MAIAASWLSVAVSRDVCAWRGVAECCFLRGHVCLRLGDAGLIDAIVDRREDLPGLHFREILNGHLRHVAVYLRADDGDAPAHVGVVRVLADAGEGW